MTDPLLTSPASIIYYYYTVVFDLVGITDPTTQTGINAGLNIFTWFCQIAAVWAGKYVGRKKILLWIWPTLLLCLVGLCVAGGVFSNAGEENTQAGVATVVLVWLYLGFFNVTSESTCPHPHVWYQTLTRQIPSSIRTPPRCRPSPCAARAFSCGTPSPSSRLPTSSLSMPSPSTRSASNTTSSTCRS